MNSKIRPIPMNEKNAKEILKPFRAFSIEGSLTGGMGEYWFTMFT